MEIPASKIELKRIEVVELWDGDIGRTVLRSDRGFKEYGILMGWTKNLVIVNFNNCRHSLKLQPKEVEFVSVKKQ